MVEIHPTLSFSSKKDEIVVINSLGEKIEVELVTLDKNRELLVLKKKP